MTEKINKIKQMNLAIISKGFLLICPLLTFYYFDVKLGTQK